MSTDTLDSLTPREREILTLIAEGNSLAEIAQSLGRSLKTIESHRLSLGRKLNASNRVELAKIAIAHGLVVLDSIPVPPRTGKPDLKQHWINEINEAIQQANGRKLVERFCKAASTLPGVDIAAICTGRRDPETGQCDVYSRVIMAISEHGQLAKPLQYNAIQTPCEQIIKYGSIIAADGVRDKFPNDPWLQQIEAESYLGLSLQQDGDSVGGVGVIGRTAIGHIKTLREVVEFFTPRLAGAVKTCIEMEMLRSENDCLHAGLVNSGTDASLDRAGSESIIRITKRINSLAGTAFLREFIDAICQENGLYSGGICALDPAFTNQTLHSVSFCIEQEQCDPIQYQSMGTPCEVVLKQGSLMLPDNAAKAYPGDDFLQEHQIRGFCGTRLPSPTGETAGVAWVVHTQPLPDPEGVQSLLRYYAPRLGAELTNFMQLELLLQERERLERQLAKQPGSRGKIKA